MTELVKKNGTTIIFPQNNVYNQDGIRISRTQGDTEREYYYNNSVVAYTEDNNELSGANIQNVDGSVIGAYRGDTYYAYLKNIQGSTASIVDEDAEVAAVYSYSDFGETEEVVTDTMDNEICYTGAIYDKETGLYYMNARYYDAVTGRFISQDSYRGEIEDVGTWHLYAYCANNPVNYVDPTGHSIVAIATKGIATIFGTVSASYLVPIAAICIGGYLAVLGYRSWKNSTQKDVQEVVHNKAQGVVTSGSCSIGFIEGIVKSVAKAKVASKKGKDEKHHIVPQTAKSTAKAKETILGVGITINLIKAV